MVQSKPGYGALQQGERLLFLLSFYFERLNMGDMLSSIGQIRADQHGHPPETANTSQGNWQRESKFAAAQIFPG